MRYQAPNSPTSAWARSRSRSSPAASSPPIELTDDVADHLSRGGYVHLCLRVDNLDQTVTGLKDRGVDVLAELFEVAPIGQLLAMIKDNSGNIIELAQAVA